MLNVNIANLRKARGISQEQLAELLNTSRQAVSKWERGESYPDLDKLKDLAVFFNVSIDYLLGYDVQSHALGAFMTRLGECTKTRKPDISLEELKIMVSTHPNNFQLITAAANYISFFWLSQSNHDTANLVIEYLERAIQVFQPDNPEGTTINDLRKSIADIHAFVGKFAEAKKYLEEHHVKDAKLLLASCELELGDSEAASSLVSITFLESALNISNGLITQVLALTAQDNIDEAYDLAKWAIGFVKSIESKENILLAFDFFNTFMLAVCDRYYKRDYQEHLDFLKENAALLDQMEYDSGAIKYYYDKKINFISHDATSSLKMEIEGPIKRTKLYADAVYVYDEVFGGKNNG